jgi:adenylate kinase
MKKLLFIGPPGSGKGTQAKLLKKYKLIQLSTGDAIRKSKDKEIIKYRNEGYARGDLLSDKLIFKIIKKEISRLPKSAKGYILDGAVRTLAQAEYVKKHNLVDEVVYYKLKKKTAIKRILARKEGRSDDTLEAAKHRFLEYKTKTKPVLKYLKKNFKFHKISAEKTPEEIHEETLKKLKLI